MTRVPPHNVPAEQSVLGGLMLDPKRSADVFDLLTAADFYRRDHQLIYTAILEASGKGKPFDSVTLGEWFESRGLLDSVDGGAYLIDLAKTTPSAANIRAYAEIVKEKSKLRGAIEIGTGLINLGYEPDGREAIEVISEAQSRLSRLVLDDADADLEESGDVVDAMYKGLIRRHELGGALDGLPTGLTELDKLLNGLKPGLLYIIAGRPAMGKSTLALNIAEVISVSRGKRGAVFSFEMPATEMMGRMACSVGDIEHDHFRTGKLTGEEWELMSMAMKRLKQAPLFLSSPGNSRIEALVARVRRLHAKAPLHYIVVDYLQLLDTKGAQNREQGIAEISRQLKMLAIDMHIPVIALSQLNRGLETRNDKRPVMSDLRESGAIEQDADAIVFVYRDEVYTKDSYEKGTAELIIGKQRDGPTGTVRVASRLNRCRFDNLARDWAIPTPPPQETKRRSRWGQVVHERER